MHVADNPCAVQFAQALGTVDVVNTYVGHDTLLFIIRDALPILCSQIDQLTGFNEKTLELLPFAFQLLERLRGSVGGLLKQYIPEPPSPECRSKLVAMTGNIERVISNDNPASEFPSLLCDTYAEPQDETLECVAEMGDNLEKVSIIKNTIVPPCSMGSYTVVAEHIFMRDWRRLASASSQHVSERMCTSMPRFREQMFRICSHGRKFMQTSQKHGRLLNSRRFQRQADAVPEDRSASLISSLLFKVAHSRYVRRVHIHSTRLAFVNTESSSQYHRNGCVPTRNTPIIC